MHITLTDQRSEPTCTRKPHSVYAGYVSERICKAACGGHIVIYDRAKGFEIDADTRWIVMHEPSSYHVAVGSREMAYDVMKWAATDPADALGVTIADLTR